jgi:G3E family GTPase
MVLTKTDLIKDPATTADIEADKQRVASMNPGASIIDRSEMAGRLL